MGLFGSAAHQAPAFCQQVEIFLDQDATRPYRPGSVVSGHIHIWFPSSAPLTIQSCQVVFSGGSSTHIRKSDSKKNGTTSTTDYRHYADLASFFVVPAQLCGSGSFSADEHYRLPFQFVFPVATGNSRSNVYRTPQDETWTVAPHELPPSYSQEGRFNSMNACYIGYSLQATLFLVNQNTMHPQATTALHYMPYSRSPSTYTCLSVTSPPMYCASSLFSHMMSQSGTTAALSLRQRMKDRVSSHTPRIAFTLHCTLPQAVVPGEPFKLTPSLLLHSRANDVTIVPSITFRFKKLELKCVTAWRAPRDGNARNTMSYQQRDVPASLGGSRGPSSYQGEETANRKIEVLLNANADDGRGMGIRKFGDSGITLPAYDRQDSETKGGEEDKTREFIGQGPQGNPSGVTNKTADKEIYECTFSVRPPLDQVPSFRSFAIALGWRIEFEIIANIAGKDFEFKQAAEIVMLAPP